MNRNRTPLVVLGLILAVVTFTATPNLLLQCLLAVPAGLLIGSPVINPRRTCADCAMTGSTHVSRRAARRGQVAGLRLARDGRWYCGDALGCGARARLLQGESR